MTIIFPATIRKHGAMLGINIPEKFLNNNFKFGDHVEVVLRPLQINVDKAETEELIFNKVCHKKMMEQNTDTLIIIREMQGGTKQMEEETEEAEEVKDEAEVENEVEAEVEEPAETEEVKAE